MLSANLKKIRDRLWAHADSDQTIQLYTVIDAARDESIHPKLLESKIKGVPLFRGDKARELATVGPYLILLRRDEPFIEWLLNNGWGSSWGIFVESHAALNELKRHFQTLLMVYDEDGKPLFFRYYDPRVLRVYLPTCNESELEIIFSPVNQYFVEGEEGNSIIEYSRANGKLAERIIQLEMT